MSIEKEKSQSAVRLRPPPMKTSVSQAVYSGFGPLSRRLILSWKKRFIKMERDPQTHAAIRSLNDRLLAGDALIFFDHHHAFDVIPAAFILADIVEYYNEAVIPYAIFLEMGINAEGEYSLRHDIRTRAFFWFLKSVKKHNPGVHFFPLAREFELNTPGIRKALENHHSGHNIAFIKKLTEMFSEPRPGNVGILAPMAGLAFPERAPMNPELYRVISSIQARREAPLPIYFVGAYSKLVRKIQYVVPVLNKHTFVARGPFCLPTADYEGSLDRVGAEMAKLRAAGRFHPPDYDIIRTHSK